MKRRAPVTEFPLHLSEVLEEELAALRPAAAPASRSWDFTPDQIRLQALPDLLARLNAPSDEVGRCLRRRLSPELRALLEKQGETGGPAPEALLETLVRDLNHLLDLREEDELPGELDRACRADGLRLSEEMEKLLADPPADSARLLRLLLEEIFPAALESRYERRLETAYRRIHEDGPGLTALCLSGGGIRSAVFSLGVVQGLARRGLLENFDYLSTVSGGGYLGGLLSAWIHRDPRGIEGVSEKLGGTAPCTRKLQPESGPLVYLREFSNYLSPKLGLLSSDSWTLVSIFLRNLYVYWLVLLPLLLAVLAVPRLFVALCTMRPPLWGALRLPFLPADRSPYLLPDGLFLLAALLMTSAVAYFNWKRPSGGQRSNSREILRFCLLPLLGSAFLLSLYWAWYRGLQREPPGWLWFVGPSLAINLLGWSIHAWPAVATGRARLGVKLREIPFLFVSGAVGGSIAFLLATAVFANPIGNPKDAHTSWSSYTAIWYGIFAAPCVLGAFGIGETLFAGLVSRWTADEDREWWGRSAAGILIIMAAWSAIGVVVILGPVLLAYWRWILTPIGGLTGVATALLARSSLTSKSQMQKDQDGLLARIMETALAFVAPLFLIILFSALSLGVSWLLAHTTSWTPPPLVSLLPKEDALALWHIDLVAKTGPPALLAFLVITLGGGLAMARLMDINKFSLHAMYRNRLIRTFLGASRENRRPNEFTGFDAEDNLEIYRLREPLFLRRGNLEANGARLCARLQEVKRPPSAEIKLRHLSEETRRLLDAYNRTEAPSPALLDALTEDCNRMIRGVFSKDLLQGLGASEEEREQLRRAVSDDQRYRLQRALLLRAFREETDTSRPPRPLHVINVALNLVSGKKLAWQDRKAESFTFSPLHSGSLRLGYRPSEKYAAGGARRQAITLGTAMAISGAAASPNMGYHSSPAITFLMTFFNARLGWWLGNPGVAGARTFADPQPGLAISPLISEALGRTDDQNRYVYLSDGGHFENLGLYEMVLRRCRYIVVVDAGQDHECRFEDLGNALRKIRIDLGIRIRLDKVMIGSETGRYCAVGDILYQEMDGDQAENGHLLYIKPSLCGGEPQDVLHYKKLNKLFPHESTADQWFSEQQFESYRILGRHAVDAICCVAGPEEEKTISGLPDLFRLARIYASPPNAVKEKNGAKAKVRRLEPRASAQA